LEVVFLPIKELCLKKSKFSEEQIVRILKEVDAGAKVGVSCRKYRISGPTYDV
jgi:putative transposase